MLKDIVTSTKIEFATLNPEDCIVVLHHIQNCVMSPEGGAKIFQPYIQKYDLVNKVIALVDAANRHKVPVVCNNEVWRPGYPELKLRRGNYVLGSARFLDIPSSGEVIQGSWGAETMDEIKDKVNYVLENPKVDPFSSDLECIMKNEERGIIVNAGIETNWGVEMCARSASEREYGVVTLYDVTDKAFEEYAEMTFKYVFPVFGRVANMSEVIEEWDSFS